MRRRAIATALQDPVAPRPRLPAVRMARRRGTDARPRYAEHSRETFDAALDTCEQHRDRAVRAAQPEERPERAAASTASGCASSPRSSRRSTPSADAGLMAPGRTTSSAACSCRAVVDAACFAWFQAANVGTVGLPVADHRQRQPAARARHAGADRHLRAADARGPVLSARCACPSRRPGSSLADITTRAEPQRRRHATGCSATRCGSPAASTSSRENIVHLVLAKIPGAPAGREGHLAVHRAQVPGRRRRLARRAQRRRRSPGSTTRWATAAPSTRCSTSARARTARRRAGRGRLPRRRAEPRPRLHVPHDERGAHRRRARARWRSATPATCKSLDYARSRPQGRPPGAKDPASPQVPIVEHADVRRMLLAQKSYVEGGTGARACTARGWSTSSDTREPRRGARAGRPAARRAHADRQELAVAVVPGGQRPRDPGARRLRLHPRLRRRAALPRQPAQPDPRGHPRHPGASTCSAARSSWRRAGLRAAARENRRNDGRGKGRRIRASAHGEPLDAARPGAGHDTRNCCAGRDAERARQRLGLSGNDRTRRDRVDLAAPGRAGRSARSRPRRATTGRSIRASCRPAGISSAGNCRRRRRRTNCCAASIRPAWRCAMSGSGWSA